MTFFSAGFLTFGLMVWRVTPFADFLTEHISFRFKGFLFSTAGALVVITV